MPGGPGLGGFEHFYPRSPCGERLPFCITARQWSFISIHALLAESDDNNSAQVNACHISIHALLAESDNKFIHRNICAHYISIHALLAESDCTLRVISAACWKFLSTLSLRRATPRGKFQNRVAGVFLSTLSLRRATAQPFPWRAAVLHFYPRSPCGERHDIIALCRAGYTISIHALLAESDAGLHR